VSREMANAAIDIWPDEAIEAMHLAALALLERAHGELCAETGVHEYPDPRRALGL